VPDAGVAALRARLVAMEDTRRVDARTLDSALRSEDPALRRAAALAAGRLVARDHRPALRRLAADTSGGVAGAALYALGLLADTGSLSLATSALGRPDVASEAAWLLGRIGEPARASLIAAVLDERSDLRARRAALLALARLRPPPVDPIVPMLANGDSGIAWRAAYVLARARSAAAVRPLLDASHSSVVDVRDYSARGLARSLAGDSLRDAALAALRPLVRDSSARVRVTAVRVLGGYADNATAEISSALHDPDAGVRVTAAAFAHVAIGDDSARWAAAWKSDTSFAFRRTLAESAMRRDALRDEWAGWRADADWRRRAAAAELDAVGAPAQAVARLERPLRDPDGRVRAAAAGALATLAESASVATEARRRLRRLLADSDFVVRASVLGALASGATLDDLSAALASHDVTQRDADLDARLAFWTLVDSALAHSPAIPESLSLALDRLPHPSDPLERARAVAIPRFAAWSDATGVSRPAEWYQARAHEALSSSAPLARIETDRGVMELVLFPADAPVTVHNFVMLANRRYFDGLRFHRVVPNFVVQAGDPRGDGNGGPGYAIRDELNPHRYGRGTLGMALSGPNTGGSQFFVTHAAQPHLDGGYTVFGQLLRGSDVLDRLVQGDRIVRITID
jgi:cyclophilin family peptidyl-prolyl cis-trans isomerase/HEAT repeat protein